MKQICLPRLFRYRFETPKQTEIFCFWFHEINQNKRETDLVSICFGSNRNLFLFVSRTPKHDACADRRQIRTILGTIVATAPCYLWNHSNRVGNGINATFFKPLCAISRLLCNTGTVPGTVWVPLLCGWIGVQGTVTPLFLRKAWEYLALYSTHLYRPRALPQAAMARV